MWGDPRGRGAVEQGCLSGGWPFSAPGDTGRGTSREKVEAGGHLWAVLPQGPWCPGQGSGLARRLGAGQGGEAAGVFRWAPRGFPAACGGRLWEQTPEKHIFGVLSPLGLSSSPRKGAGLDGWPGGPGTELPPGWVTSVAGSGREATW